MNDSIHEKTKFITQDIILLEDQINAINHNNEAFENYNCDLFNSIKEDINRNEDKLENLNKLKGLNKLNFSTKIKDKEKDIGKYNLLLTNIKSQISSLKNNDTKSIKQ